MKQTLCFDDALLVPQYSEISSRKNIDISNKLTEEITLELPIISAPMDMVTENEMASSMREHGGLGIIHRFNTIQEQCALIRRCLPRSIVVGAAVGVQGDFLARAQETVGSGAKIICVDVAHGHHALVKEAIHKLKSGAIPGWVHIMVGNVATAEAFYDLAKWGADSIKVGIGGGSICSTRIKTGHGIPTLQSIMDCAVVAKEQGVKLIADGGIKNSGDIVKALAAGADFVMLGSLLSGASQAPGIIVSNNSGERMKVYRGMSSREAQQSWKGSVSSHEGISTYVKYKGDVSAVLKNLEVGIRSGFSYSGAENLAELQHKRIFIQQTTASARESSTHILDNT